MRPAGVVEEAVEVEVLENVGAAMGAGGGRAGDDGGVGGAAGGVVGGCGGHVRGAGVGGGEWVRHGEVGVLVGGCRELDEVGMQLWSWYKVVLGLSVCSCLSWGLMSWVVTGVVVEESQPVQKAEA